MTWHSSQNMDPRGYFSLRSSFARSFVRAGEIEISHPVIRRRGEPDSSLRVEKKFPHHGFGMREWIFDYFSGLRIQASNQILIRGSVPNPIVLPDNDRIGSRCRAGQWVLLERFRLRIK